MFYVKLLPGILAYGRYSLDLTKLVFMDQSLETFSGDSMFYHATQ